MAGRLAHGVPALPYYLPGGEASPLWQVGWPMVSQLSLTIYQGEKLAFTILIDDIPLSQERQRKVDDGDGAGEDGQATSGNISWQGPLLS